MTSIEARIWSTKMADNQHFRYINKLPYFKEIYGNWKRCLKAYSYTRKEHWTWSTNMAAMASKFNFECVIQYYTDQCVVGLNGSTTLYVFAITLYNSMYLICYARYLAAIKVYLLSFVETPRKFIIAELSIRKFGSSSVLIIRLFEFTRPFLYIVSWLYARVI